MLIPFKKCCSLSPTQIKGIIHLGAHDLEELPQYLNNGINKNKIIWIEAMEQKVKLYNNNHKIYNICVSDTDDEEVIFKITNNGQSSSILDFGTHQNSYKEIVFIKYVPMKTTRMDTLITRENININDYNFLNLDLQGVELKALKGFGNLLNKVDYIYTEVNTAEVYINCCKLEEIDEYLATFGFVRVATELTSEYWGDAYYIRKTLL
jgi:FkbM family methyltransferase